MFQNLLKRKTVITGHYGSGKTEFAVSLAMLMTERKRALIDLDVVNPYFRSREQREMLEKAGVSVYGDAFGTEITAEIPEIGATVRTPLEDPDTYVIVDLGGNDSGAMIINQFIKYFKDNETLIIAIVNANRPDTNKPDTAAAHIRAIEERTNLTVTHIVNNTHMLRETTAHDIEKGHLLCTEVCGITGKKLLCDCYPKEIINPEDLSGLQANLMPLGLYMRPSFLDK